MPDPSNPLSSPIPPVPPGRPVLGQAPGEGPPAPPPAVSDEFEEEPLDPSLPIPKGAEARAVLEALLFAATTPLSLKRLSRLMNGVDPLAVRELLDEMQMEYAREGRGVVLMEVAGGFQLGTRPSLADWIYRLHRHRKKTGLTPAALETLAIVAYKQPITRADIEAIRGVDCGGLLRQIQDMGLVEVVGRREVVGRPPLYGTTELFLKTFGLKRLADLPSLEELHLLLSKSDLPIAGQGELFPAHERPSEATEAAIAEAMETPAPPEPPAPANQTGPSSE